ncbi:MAG: protein phosphatase 2C domain-containing protein [Phycisphaerae bacterium]
MEQRVKPQFAGMTDRGLKRDANEDHFLICDLNKSMVVHETSLDVDPKDVMFSGSQGQLYLVADGIGGDAAGERASELAIQTMAQYVLNVLPWFFRLYGEDEEDLYEELKHAMGRCEEVIGAESAAVPECEGMGTTLTVAYVLWPKMYVVHVGDSRCYVLRGKKLQQITRDHTMAQSLVDQGAMKAKDIEDSPWIHVLWNALGKGAEKLSPEVYMADLEAGDTVMLCTDGLWQELPEKRVIDILRTGEEDKETCRRLVDAANDAGGSDNITVIVARYVAP